MWTRDRISIRLELCCMRWLTGNVPFDGDNPVSVAMMHMNEAVPPPSRINPSVSPALDKVVLKATAKHQPDRYKSADEMYEALVQAENAIVSEQSGMGLREFYAIPRDSEKNPQDGGYDDFGNYRDFDEEEDEEKGLLQENSPERRRKVRRKILPEGTMPKRHRRRGRFFP